MFDSKTVTLEELEEILAEAEGMDVEEFRKECRSLETQSSHDQYVPIP
jgi:uncharacterized protein YqfB (UPF0267 family)